MTCFVHVRLTCMHKHYLHHIDTHVGCVHVCIAVYEHIQICKCNFRNTGSTLADCQNACDVNTYIMYL